MNYHYIQSNRSLEKLRWDLLYAYPIIFIIFPVSVFHPSYSLRTHYGDEGSWIPWAGLCLYVRRFSWIQCMQGNIWRHLISIFSKILGVRWWNYTKIRPGVRWEICAHGIFYHGSLWENSCLYHWFALSWGVLV